MMQGMTWHLDADHGQVGFGSDMWIPGKLAASVRDIRQATGRTRPAGSLVDLRQARGTRGQRQASPRTTRSSAYMV
jgi:hypothetical protein